jgi:hypothetical protein
VREGVYVYGTRGSEQTDALTGVTHRYPRRSAITVTSDPCGVRLRWDVLEGRSTAWTYCVSGRTWELARQDERHTFFGRTERTTYVCDDAPVRPTSGPGTYELSCSTDGVREQGTIEVLAPERIRVAGESVTAERVRKRSRFTGDTSGTALHELWLDARSGIPVRLVMVSRTTSDSPIGDVRYEERVALRLLSLQPRK